MNRRGRWAAPVFVSGQLAGGRVGGFAALLLLGVEGFDHFQVAMGVAIANVGGDQVDNRQANDKDQPQDEVVDGVRRGLQQGQKVHGGGPYEAARRALSASTCSLRLARRTRLISRQT